MKRSLFFHGQFVLPDDLNNIETSAINQIKYRTQGILSSGSAGIFGYAADSDDGSKNLYLTKDSPIQITVAPGKAINVNGEFIVVPSANTMQYAVSDSHYSWFSGYESQKNYIKLRYQEASGAMRATAAGTSYYTKYEGGYYIDINGIPNTSTELLLGTFTSDVTGAISGAITDERTYVQVLTTASASVLDPTTIESVLGHRNVEDHVRASGSTTPSNINAHGLTPADILAAPASNSITMVPKYNNALTMDEVYQNSSGSTMFLSCTVQMYDVTNVGDPSWIAIMASVTGSVGAAGVGYLTPPYYQLNTKAFLRLTTDSADHFIVTAAVRAFVPPNWFYQITKPLNYLLYLPPAYSSNTGTILNSLRYW